MAAAMAFGEWPTQFTQLGVASPSPEFHQAQALEATLTAGAPPWGIALLAGLEELLSINRAMSGDMALLMAQQQRLQQQQRVVPEQRSLRPNGSVMSPGLEAIEQLTLRPNDTVMSPGLETSAAMSDDRTSFLELVQATQRENDGLRQELDNFHQAESALQRRSEEAEASREKAEASVQALRTRFSALSAERDALGIRVKVAERDVDKVTNQLAAARKEFGEVDAGYSRRERATSPSREQMLLPGAQRRSSDMQASDSAARLREELQEERRAAQSWRQAALDGRHSRNSSPKAEAAVDEKSSSRSPQARLRSAVASLNTTRRSPSPSSPGSTAPFAESRAAVAASLAEASAGVAAGGDTSPTGATVAGLQRVPLPQKSSLDATPTPASPTSMVLFEAMPGRSSGLNSLVMRRTASSPVSGSLGRYYHFVA